MFLGFEMTPQEDQTLTTEAYTHLLENTVKFLHIDTINLHLEICPTPSHIFYPIAVRHRTKLLAKFIHKSSKTDQEKTQTELIPRIIHLKKEVQVVQNIDRTPPHIKTDIVKNYVSLLVQTLRHLIIE